MMMILVGGDAADDAHLQHSFLARSPDGTGKSSILISMGDFSSHV